MAKDKSTYEARTFRLPPDLLKRMDAYSDETSIPKTAIVEKALLKYLDTVAPIKKTK